jgi:hypothetical protein
MTIPKVVSIRLEDGCDAWEVNGIRKNCCFPMNPLATSQGLITPQKQCTTQCTHCNIIDDAIEITCSGKIRWIITEQRKETITSIKGTFI